MTNQHDAYNWLREAGSRLQTARSLMRLDDLTGIAQACQLCVEQSAKGVIACFNRPSWRHDASLQLRSLISANDTSIRDKLGDAMVEQLIMLANDARDAAPWHAWATYGREKEDGTWSWPIDLCTQTIAQWLLDLAERSFEAASEFIKHWLPNPQEM